MITLNANSTTQDKLNYLQYLDDTVLFSPVFRNRKKADSIYRLLEFTEKEAERLENL